MKNELYLLLINRVPAIRDAYRQKRKTSKSRIYAWIYLLYLNVTYYAFRNKNIRESEKYPYYEEKKLYSKLSESSISKLEEPNKFASKLAMYDVISLDVFDTLVLRPFSTPSDLFFLLGDKINYLNFQQIRCEMEQKARIKKYEKDNHYEVSLEDIYDEIALETGLCKDEVMHMELDLEYTYCFANPYMLQVVQELLKQNKKIIIISDMYLNTEQIQTLLSKCGYPKFNSYYVSCDCKKSKSKGDLYDVVKVKEGLKATYAHVGDNAFVDVKQARKHNFIPYPYHNVNIVGNSYRAEDMSAIVGSIYRGIINAHIHNGLHIYSKEYEFGYIYGGLFLVGYCQFIHSYVQSHANDHILFLARDGELIWKAYEKLYPKTTIKLSYVYWSRLAALKMTANYYKYDYFQRFLYQKVNQKYTLAQIFITMELEDMLEEMCHVMTLTPETLLTNSNVESVKQYLMDSWEEVLLHYENQRVAAKQYYATILNESQNAVVVDIGWAGSGAIMLNYLVNEVWGVNCKMIGIVAGTNSRHSTEPNASETFLQSGQIISYLYSQRENRDIWKLHNPAQNHNLYWEMLLGSVEGSFKGFYLNQDGLCECQHKSSSINAQKVESLQQGALYFVKQYCEMQKKLTQELRISGRDAYAPMVNVQGNLNKEFMKQFGQNLDNTHIE